MKNRLSSIIFIGFFMLGILFFSTSCSDDKSEPDAYFDKDIITVSYTDWEWVVDGSYINEGYYVAKKPVSILTDYIYNYGIVTFYSVFSDGVLTPLPYTKSYGYDVTYEDGTVGREYYTESVSCEFYPGGVAFIIEASDLQRADEYLTNREFEIRMVW